MKKYILKICIAFTLTEMTIVLLIMSILAAATTPIITKSISDSNEKIYQGVNAPPWLPLKDVGGAYYKPASSSAGNAVVSIGLLPQNANSVYDNPALSVFSYGSTVSSYPQFFGLHRKDGAYMKLAQQHSFIALDPLSNILISTLSTPDIGNSSGTSIVRDRNIYIGSYLLPVNQKNKYTTKSIYLGNHIQAYSANNSVLIGSYLTSATASYNNVFVGHGIQTISGDVRSQNNLFIGAYAGYGTNSAYNVKIGYYAGNSSDTGIASDNRSISIGWDSGKKSVLYASDVISIGNGAGYYANNSDINIGGGHDIKKVSSTFQDNINIGANIGPKTNYGINIGYYAASRSYYYNDTTLKRYNSIAIGYFSMYGNTSTTTSSLSSDIAIGNYASLMGTSNIAVGNHIGSYSGMYATSKAGNGENVNSIYIGYGAGVYSFLTGNNNIVIGTHAGSKLSYNATAYNSIQKLQGFTALGYASCSNNSAEGLGLTNKLCIGPGPIPTAQSGRWAKLKSATVIGNRFYSPTSNYVTLYSGAVYSMSALNNMSDKRMKEDIVPSKHSLKDLRKVNIYNFNFKGDNTPRIGVIAQEYRKIFPHGVVVEPETKYLTVKFDWLLYTAVNSVKELDNSVTQLELDLKAYIKDFMGLKSKVAKLEKQASQLRQQNAMIKARLNKMK